MMKVKNPKTGELVNVDTNPVAKVKVEKVESSEGDTLPSVRESFPLEKEKVSSASPKTTFRVTKKVNVKVVDKIAIDEVEVKDEVE